jgi:hypothetical protein
LGIGVKGDGLNLNDALVPDIGPPVKLGIAVHHFPINLRPGDSNAISMSGNRGEVQDTNQMLAFSSPDVGNNAALGILAVNPGKSLGKMIPFPERRVLAVKGA